MNKREREILRIIYYDLGCMTNPRDKDNLYHFKLAKGNLIDLIKGDYK